MRPSVDLKGKDSSGRSTGSEISEEAISGLQSILQDIIVTDRELIGVLQEEKRRVVEGEIEDLAVCLRKKEELVGRLKLLDEAMWRALVRNYPENPPRNLRELVLRLPESEREGFRTCRLQLEALTASVQEINEMNGVLVDRFLQQITGILGLLKQLAFNTPTYQPTGLICESGQGGRTIGRG